MITAIDFEKYIRSQLSTWKIVYLFRLNITDLICTNSSTELMLNAIKFYFGRENNKVCIFICASPSKNTDKYKWKNEKYCDIIELTTYF
jgi:hypothetical protein